MLRGWKTQFALLFDYLLFFCNLNMTMIMVVVVVMIMVTWYDGDSVSFVVLAMSVLSTRFSGYVQHVSACLFIGRKESLYMVAPKYSRNHFISEKYKTLQ